MKLLLVLIAFVALSCSEPALIPNEVRSHVLKFENEAAKRGYFITVEVDIFLGHYETSFYDPNKNAIFIDTASENYKKTREELITHELGHAVLNRDHDFSKLPNLCYKSVMGNFSNRMYSGWSSAETSFREKYYYDELFNPSVSTPDWAISHIGPK